MLKNKRLLALTALMFAFSLFIAWSVPYTHDDWDWGRQIGIENWLTGRYNNRYVGTFFVIVMTRLPLVKTLVMALTMTALPLLCTYLARGRDWSQERTALMAVAAYFVVFAMPVITWRQTYGWVAGFSNFTMGSLFLLLLMAALKYAVNGSCTRPWLLGAGCLILGFAAQLCSENISMFFPVLLVVAMVLVRFWKRRELTVVFLAALIGTALGTLLMFFNPLYVNLATSGASPEQFRSLTVSLEDPILTILGTLLTLLFGEVLPSLYETHPILTVVLALGAWIELGKTHRKAAAALCIPMLAYGIFVCYCAHQMRWVFGWLPSSAALRTAGAAAFTLLWLISVLISREEHKWHVLVLSLFALALTTPFAAIKHMGPRCYHISHFCLLAAGLSRFAGMKFTGIRRIVTVAALAVTVVYLTRAYAAIGSADRLRSELTRQALQTQADTLVLPSVDGEFTYSWGYNPQSDLRAEHYREYYGLPEDMNLIFLPYGSADLWPDVPEEMFQSAMIYPGK